MTSRLLFVELLLFTMCFNHIAIAETGVDADSIRLGQSCALSGPYKELGLNMCKGARAYFTYINSIGGVHGRRIEQVVLDDRYEPFEAENNTNTLISEKRVFAIFGEVGTPTSKYALPAAEKADVPFLMPFTGADFLRTPEKRWVINLRASYDDEVEAMVKFITETKGVKKIAVFYQDDAYGKAGLSSTNKALSKRGIKLVANETYYKKIDIPEDVFERLRAASPDAIIMIGAYLPCANFIKGATRSGMENTLFCNVSFVGSETLVRLLDGNTKNVLISQVVPLPWDSSNPAVQEYQKLFRKIYPGDDFGFVSLEGFLAAKLTVKGLERAGQNPTRESFIAALETIDKNALEGLSLSLGKDHHQAMNTVYLTSYDNAKFQEIKRVTFGSN